MIELKNNQEPIIKNVPINATKDMETNHFSWEKEQLLKLKEELKELKGISLKRKK